MVIQALHGVRIYSFSVLLNLLFSFFFFGSGTHVTKHPNTSSTILNVLHFLLLLLLLCTITFSCLLHFQPPPPSFGPLNGLHCLLISYLEPSSTVSVEQCFIGAIFEYVVQNSSSLNSQILFLACSPQCSRFGN